MDRVIFVGCDRSLLVHGFTGHVEHPAHHRVTDGHGNWSSRIGHFRAAGKTFRRGHRHGPHPVVTEVLLHFEGQLGFLTARRGEGNGQGVVDGGDFASELHVHYGADNLNDLACAHYSSF